MIDVSVFNERIARHQLSKFSSDKETYRTDFDYKAITWHADPFFDTSPIHVYTGSAGGGKSRLAAEKVHYNLNRYPGSMWLMARKTRSSMRNSTVLFYASKIAGRDKRIRHLKSDNRFEYPNGSILAYGGMKDEEQREQIRSIGLDGGLDGFWLEEANRFKREDFQELLPRLRGKASPYQQALLTTNPDAPLHWIYIDLIMNHGAKVWYSSAADNPFNPPDYVDKLKLLTGIQRDRLVYGLWKQAEGAIYDNWSEDNINDDKAVYDPALPIIWYVDDGYKNPRVILLAQEHSDGTICIVDEYYKSQQLFETTFDDLVAKGYPLPPFVVHDPAAAEFAAFLWSRGIQTVAADNTVSEGIKSVRSYIRDGNGIISLYVSARCKNLIEEMVAYVWDEDSAYVQGGDPKPIKENDHTCDALRYGIHTPHALRIPRGGW